jgi:hypothetical protein
VDASPSPSHPLPVDVRQRPDPLAARSSPSPSHGVTQTCRGRPSVHLSALARGAHVCTVEGLPRASGAVLSAMVAWIGTLLMRAPLPSAARRLVCLARPLSNVSRETAPLARSKSDGVLSSSGESLVLCVALTSVIEARALGPSRRRPHPRPAPRSIFVGLPGAAPQTATARPPAAPVSRGSASVTARARLPYRR